jgi:predicted metal-dependent hydrolase
MTHQLVVGATVIPYTVRASAKARAMKIVATPSGDEVVVPPGSAEIDVAAYVAKKRRWVFNAVRELAARHETLLDQQYGSGAKLQYRGRWLMLDVQPGDVNAVEIACRSKLHVTVPVALTGVPRMEAVRAAFDLWLRARAKDDLDRFGRKHANTQGSRRAGSACPRPAAAGAPAVPTG